jgi:hypothetical protein
VISDVEAEAFLASVSAAVLKDLTGLAFPGSNTALEIAPYAVRFFHTFLKKYNIVDIPALFDALTRIPFARAFAVVETQAARSDIEEDLKREVVKYLSAIPMTSREALHRFDDGGHVTTLLSQVPHTIEEIARLMPARTPRFQPGYRIPGYDYRLEILLGQGGFAEVWKAGHTELQEQPPVALKFCLDEELLPSLRREIEIVGVLLRDHTSDKDIVRLLGTAYSADPPFLIYEYIDGGNLCGWVDSFAGAAPSPKDVIRVLSMTARAVAIAHDRNIAHCDLKPANLLITREGRVKIADFGIGRVVAKDGDGKNGALPYSAAVAGVAPSQESTPALEQAYTPAYRDPRRDRAMPAGLPYDVYAMGVIGYQLLVGDATDRMEGGWRRYLEARGAPNDLVDIIETCVAPPGERYVNAGALLAALEHCGKPAKARPEKPRAGAKPKTVVRFCHYCGTRSLAERRFCSNCGYRFPG